MACARLIAEIDHRMQHIKTHVGMGSCEAEVTNEQYTALLHGVSMLTGVTLADTDRVSNHLKATGAFSRTQLLAFSASLRAAAATSRVVKVGSRGMQTNEALEHFLLQPEWDRIRELGASPKKGRDEIESLLAQRMHRLGMVCPDPDTLKRASAIVQAVSSTRATPTDKRSYAHSVKTKN